MTTYRLLLVITAFSSALITATFVKPVEFNSLPVMHSDKPNLQQPLQHPGDSRAEHEMLANNQLGLMTLAYSRCAQHCDFLQVKQAVEKARHYEKFGI